MAMWQKGTCEAITSAPVRAMCPRSSRRWQMKEGMKARAEAEKKMPRPRARRSPRVARAKRAVQTRAQIVPPAAASPVFPAAQKNQAS